MINNVDTDWGNGAKGIQIGQMSFGSIGNPINQDNGDNGTGAEARLVNNATYNAGIALSLQLETMEAKNCISRKR